MAYCKIKPNSSLYDSIESLTNNRKNSLLLYTYFTSESFKNKAFSELQFSDNGEPTFESVQPFINLGAVQSEKSKLQIMAKELNATKNNLIVELVEKVVEFNKVNPDHIGVITTLKTGESRVEVFPVSADSQMKKDQFEKAYNTYKIIDANLQQLGIPVTILNSEIMKFEDGFFNPQALNDSVSGLYGVINIANNMQGFEALPEEYAHLVIEALKDTPIIRRLENLITDEITREVLGNDYESVISYYSAKNRPDLISREVLGRIYSQILSDTLTTTELPKSLLSRGWAQIVNFIKKFFSKGSIKSISEQIESIKDELQSYNKTKSPETAITPVELQQLKLFGEQFAHTKANVEDVEKTFEKILTNLAQHIVLFQDNEKSSDLIAREEGLFQRLIQAKDEQNKIEGILTYVTESVNLMKMAGVGLNNIQKSLSSKTKTSFEKAKYNAHVLREIKSYLDSYQGPITSVLELCNDIIKNREALPEELQVSDEDLQALQMTAFQLHGLLFTLEDNYKILGKEVLYHFYKDFFNKDGEDILLPNGKAIKLMQLFDEVEGDINLLDRWVQCTAESPDMLSQLVDRAIQDKQQEIRQKTLPIVNRIIELDQQFKLDGGGSTDFIYERDSEGNPVGYLLSPYNYAQYNKDKEAYTRTDKQFLESSPEEQAELLRIWDDNNGQRIEDVKEYPVGGTVLKSKRYYTVPSDKYLTNTLDKLTPVQKRYYDEYMKLKREMDWLLPPGKTSPYMAIQKMVENSQEIVLGHNVSGKEKFNNLMKSFLNEFRITENDEAIYGTNPKAKSLFKRVLTNFDKTVHNQIPIYYTSLLKDKKMLSTDASSAMIDYVVMANNYSGMHQIVDLMEITKDIAKVRTVKTKSQGKLAKSVFKYAGVTFESDAEEQATMTKTVERLNETIETQVYGIQRITSSNELLKFNLDKAMDALMKYTAFSMLGYNMFTGINNVIVGKMQMFIEGMGGEFFDLKEWAAGDLYYTRNIPEMMSELHTIKNTTKLGLIGEQFNVGLSWKSKLKDKKFYANSVTNAINTLHASFLLNAGEHHMQMSTAIAMLKHIKVKNSKGDQLSLFDALEVRKNEYKGKVLTANLVVKDGVINLDGSKITDKQLRDISLQIGKVNQELHGIYNSEDAIGAKRYLAGRAFTMFRNFLVPTMNKRFKGMGGRYNYSFYHNMVMEGTYISAWKVSKQYIQHLLKPADIAKINFSEEFLRTLPEHEQKYLRHQRANLKRFATEISALILLTVALGILFDDDDTTDKTWGNRSMYYFLKRLQLEMTLYPFPIGAGETMLVSPTPIITPIKNTFNVLESLFNGYDILENGPYKGKTHLHRDFMKWLPIYNNIYDFYNLNEDDKRFKIFETD